jgi:hypothetical protein
MPQAPHRQHRYPGQGYSLAQAAEAGQIVVIRCALCRRVVNYLAADLCTLLDPHLDARGAHFPCGKCRTREYLQVKLRVPAPGDFGSLMVRRPAGLRQIRIWRDLPLGEDL